MASFGDAVSHSAPALHSSRATWCRAKETGGGHPSGFDSRGTAERPLSDGAGQKGSSHPLFIGASRLAPWILQKLELYVIYHAFGSRIFVIS